MLQRRAEKVIRLALVIVVLQDQLIRFRVFVKKHSRLMRAKWGVILTVKAIKRLIHRRYGFKDYFERLRRQTKMTFTFKSLIHSKETHSEANIIVKDALNNFAWRLYCKYSIPAYCKAVYFVQRNVRYSKQFNDARFKYLKGFW